MNKRLSVSAAINKGFLIFKFPMKLTFESVMPLCTLCINMVIAKAKTESIISKQFKHIDRIVTIYYNYFLCTFMVLEK